MADMPCNMLYLLDMNNLKAILYLLWELLDILSVLSRQQHGLDTGTQSANELLLDTTNSSNAAT